jgi:hypothetical protein
MSWLRRKPSRKETLDSYTQPIGTPVLVEDRNDVGYEYPARIVGPARFGPLGDSIVHPVRMERTGDLFLVGHEEIYAPDRVDSRWEPMQPVDPFTPENSPLMMYFVGWYRYYEGQGGPVPGAF